MFAHKPPSLTLFRCNPIATGGVGKHAAAIEPNSMRAHPIDHNHGEAGPARTLWGGDGDSATQQWPAPVRKSCKTPAMSRSISQRQASDLESANNNPRRLLLLFSSKPAAQRLFACVVDHNHHAERITRSLIACDDACELAI